MNNKIFNKNKSKIYKDKSKLGKASEMVVESLSSGSVDNIRNVSSPYKTLNKDKELENYTNKTKTKTKEEYLESLQSYVNEYISPLYYQKIGIDNLIGQHLRKEEIMSICDKLKTAILKPSETLLHVALKGRPGCGKTHLLSLAMEHVNQSVNAFAHPYSIIVVNILNSASLDVNKLLEEYTNGLFDDEMRLNKNKLNWNSHKNCKNTFQYVSCHLLKIADEINLNNSESLPQNTQKTKMARKRPESKNPTFRILIIDEIDQITNKNWNALNSFLDHNHSCPIALVSVTNDCNFTLKIHRGNNHNLLESHIEIRPYDSTQILQFLNDLVHRHHRHYADTIFNLASKSENSLFNETDIENPHCFISSNLLKFISKHSHSQNMGDLRLSVEFLQRILFYAHQHIGQATDEKLAIRYIQEEQSKSVGGSQTQTQTQSQNLLNLGLSPNLSVNASLNSQNPANTYSLEIPYSKKLLLFLLMFNLEINLNDLTRVSSIKNTFLQVCKEEGITSDLSEDIQYLHYQGVLDLVDSNKRVSSTTKNNNNYNNRSNSVKSRNRSNSIRGVRTNSSTNRMSGTGTDNSNDWVVILKKNLIECYTIIEQEQYENMKIKYINLIQLED